MKKKVRNAEDIVNWLLDSIPPKSEDKTMPEVLWFRDSEIFIRAFDAYYRIKVTKTRRQ